MIEYKKMMKNVKFTFENWKKLQKSKMKIT